MADDGKSTFEIQAKTTLDPNFERLEKLMLGPQPFVINVSGGSGYKPPPGYGSPQQSGGATIPGSSTNKQLELQFQRGSLQYFKEFPKFTKNFTNLSTELASGMKGMWGLGRALLGLGGGTGIVGATAGAMYALSRDAASKGRFAAGVGSTVGGVAAADTFLSRFGDVSAQLGAISKAQMGPGPERRGLIALGLGGKLNEDTGKLLEDAEQAWAERLKNMPLSIVSGQANATGISSIFSDDASRRLKAAGPQSVAEQIKLAEEHRKQMEWSKELTDNFQKLNEQVALAWNEIEKDFVENLAGLDLKPFVSDITKLGAEAATLTGQFVTFGQGIVDVIDHLTHPGKDWFKAKPGELLRPPVELPKDSPFMKGWEWLKKEFDIGAKADELDFNKKLNAGGGKGTFTDLPVPSFVNSLTSSGKSMPVADAPLLDWFKQNFPAGGAGETSGTAGISDVRGAAGGRLSSTYWPGGMGPAGKPRSLTRGGGESVGGHYSTPASTGKGELTNLISTKANEMAKRYNVDATYLADTMEGIRAGESLHTNYYDKKDDTKESSWGPFQLNRRRGLGVQFEKDTGLDVRDPSTIPAQAEWVAKYLATGHGTGAWMGFHGRRKADPRWGDSGYNPGAVSKPIARGGGDISHELSPSGAEPAAFIMHHTAGRGTPQDVVNFWKQQGRGYGAQYIMDRYGKVHDTLKEFGYGGTNEILNDPIHGLSNRNVVGMEIIAKDDADVLPNEVSSAVEFMRKYYPNTPIYGHGQVNPGHKEATEGQSARIAVEADRKRMRGYAGMLSDPGMPHRPVTPTPNNHIGNMAHFEQDRGVRVHVANEAGANITVKTAMMNGSGSYGG
jgi:N-acetylmuramoyl-L-alanine amidase